MMIDKVKQLLLFCCRFIYFYDMKPVYKFLIFVLALFAYFYVKIYCVKSINKFVDYYNQYYSITASVFYEVSGFIL